MPHCVHCSFAHRALLLSNLAGLPPGMFACMPTCLLACPKIHLATTRAATESRRGWLPDHLSRLAAQCLHTTVRLAAPGYKTTVFAQRPRGHNRLSQCPSCLCNSIPFLLMLFAVLPLPSGTALTISPCFWLIKCTPAILGSPV